MNKRHYEHTLPNIRGSLSNTYDLGANFYRYKKNGRMGIWNLSLCNAYFKANPFSVRPIYYQTEKGREVVLEQTLLFLFVPSVSYTYKF